MVQLYLSECAIVFAQYERHSDTMREKGQDESFNTALPFDLTWPLEAGDFDEKWFIWPENDGDGYDDYDYMITTWRKLW